MHIFNFSEKEVLKTGMDPILISNYGHGQNFLSGSQTGMIPKKKNLLIFLYYDWTGSI